LKKALFLNLKGDSGGPLVVNIGNKWMLGGLTSFGRGCNDGGVYTRTSNYYSWIVQKLQQDQAIISKLIAFHFQNPTHKSKN
jgi:secreted trypsin-like serine protease